MIIQRKFAITLSVLVVILFLHQCTNAQTPYRVTIQQGVSVRMRDGVSLVADIYRPVSDEKFPVLLERTPYNRKYGAATDTEVTGFISLELYASTSPVDTDFTALVVDVDESGYARLLTDGIVRARYRESTKNATAVVPGKIYKYTIDLWGDRECVQGGSPDTFVHFEQ
ncbi:MAG TPA: CocE/NonD family hydrolase C-terminal non-catalytic domain-containing protein [Pyrinomonadaceae bacterium]|nr:CocE/NonD family hydrolase C-terminal non-catalytic domain-containing protein [Pyrinomonadaceae bacterium]